MFYEQKIQTGFRGYPSITAEVVELVEQSGIQNGLCIVSVPHTTASLVITSFWDPRGLDDLLDEIDRNIPTRVSYKHQDSPYDASGHVKSAIIGSSKTLLIKDGKLVLGSSQGLVLLEHDGPRPRKYYVQLIPQGKTSMFFSQLSLQTRYMGMHDITADIVNTVDKSGIQSGICHVAMLHSTAGLIVCHKSEQARADVMIDIERMVPTRVDFKHRETASDAGGHVKTALTDSQLSLIVQDGKLQLGPEQAVVFAEYDGPRPRSVTVGIFPARQ